MKVKYYGVPHNAITLRNFLFAKGIKVSQTRSERLFTLYKWLIEEPRQWENVGAASHRADAPSFYGMLSLKDAATIVLTRSEDLEKALKDLKAIL